MTAARTAGTRPGTDNFAVSHADFRRRKCLDGRGAVHGYDRDSYNAEKRDGLEKWATHLESLGLAAAVAKFEATVQWPVDGKWWDKRLARVASLDEVPSAEPQRRSA